MARSPAGEAPGLVVLQIDGLALPLLERALRERRMPTLTRWIAGGSHRLLPWECSLPSQTSASQSGILYGDNFDIPGFRWYEKESRCLRVSDHPPDAAVIAARHSTGRGLLCDDGSSISNLVAGDAVRSFLTMSTFGQETAPLPQRARSFFGFFLNPLTFGRTLALMVLEMLIELWEGERQRLADVRPRVRRGLGMALLRAVSNALLRELSVYLLRHDLAAGAPSVYCDFVGYDEVAHHAGPERADALRVLRGIDRCIGVLERAARRAPRSYQFVVLSDHGQSQGATFHERAGRTLAEFVDALTGDGADVHAAAGRGEGLGHVSALLSEGLRALRPFQRLLPHGRAGASRNYVSLRPGREFSEDDVPHAVVCASGNLAHVYFAQRPGRLSLEAIQQMYPRIVDGLLNRPEIGFLLVRSDEHGPLALGRHGIRYLAEDRPAQGQVEGQDPLEPFGPRAAEALRRLDSFPHVGDIVVNSLFDPATQEVAAFEELVGVHGGLGGLQTRPFLLIPAQWSEPAGPIVGAPALYDLLRDWMPALGARRSDPPEPIAPPPGQPHPPRL